MKRAWGNLAFVAWPEIDRIAWQAPLRDGDVLNGCGQGAHRADATRRTLLTHCAGWLGWVGADQTA